MATPATETAASPSPEPPAERTGPPSPNRAASWAAVVVPLVALAILLGVLLSSDPLRDLTTAPPAEAVAVERVTLNDGAVELRVRNDGAEPVTIAQVLVNDAYWDHATSRRTLERYESATVDLTYPWQDGLPLVVTFVTATGLTFEHDIEVATLTPPFDGQTLARYAWIGLLVGAVPVAIGLLWLPAIGRASRTILRAVLAFTVGLLVVLLVDTVAEGLELAGEAPVSLRGLQVFAGAGLAVLVAMAAIDRALGAGRAAGLATAYLVAAAIGLHNAGEGIAIGAAVATGQLALGSSLLVGFAVHNSTEGLAIASPLAGGNGGDRGGGGGRVALPHLAGLVAAAGGPTVLGAWAGGLAFSPLWAAAMFGMAAGAIAQVVLTLGRLLLGTEDAEPGITPPVAVGFVAGLAVMYVTGLLTA